MTDPRPPTRPPPDEPVSVGYARRTTRPRWAIPPVWIIVVLVLMVPLALVCLMPSWVFRKDPAPRSRCASNLLAIGQAVLVFANDDDGKLPEGLQALIDDGSLVPRQLVSPLSGNREPACDYYYVTGLTWDDPPDWIVAYADPAYRNGIGANVLYLDGHVVFVMEPEFSQQLQRFKAAYEQDRGEPATIIPPH